MANAAVDKLKALGIRHGEKAVVFITAIVFVVFVGLAIINPVIDMTPKELETKTNEAKSTLSTKQSESDILAKLEKDGLKEPNFEKIIEGQIANALKPDGYRARLDWVIPEPGAGLIRDQPELIAPVDLTAFPGRGGIVMYALDDKGERKIDQGDPKRKGGGRPGGASLSLGGPTAPGANSGRKLTPDEQRARDLEEKKQKNLIVGDAAPTEKGKDEAAEAAPQGPYLEETKGKRWVVITATLDNAKLKKNYLMALKNEAIAYPNFKRVDVQRQVLQTDGSWSEWELTEKEKNWEVLDNLPETEPEFVPEAQRPPALVDSLPFLKAGYWTGVHVAKLVPPEILAKSKEAKGAPGGGGPGGADDAAGGGPRGGQSRQPSTSAGAGGGGRPGGASLQGTGGESRPKGPAGMSGGPGNPGGPAEDSFTHYDEGTLMIRSLDFTVEPDQTYRFRLRIVVVNPNRDRTDVNPGVDVESKSLFGPWSEASPAVTVPADIVAYAAQPELSERRDDIVRFSVVRWVPDNGQTVIKDDSRSPGQIIGEYGSVQMPSPDGGGAKTERVDFNSRSLVLDTFGGRQKLPDFGVPRNQVDVPALAMIVESDGTVVIRSQAMDSTDEVRDDMEANYKQALKDSNIIRGAGSGSRIGGVGQGGRKKKKGSRGGGVSRPGSGPGNS